MADMLWEDYGICVRAGAHCAPLMHKALGTVEQGVVRFSFSHTNTREEALAAASAVRSLAQELIMRTKRPYIVLSFRTTVEAMAWEKHCEAEHFPGGSFRCPGSSLLGAALRGGCRPRTGRCGRAASTPLPMMQQRR